MIDFIIKAETGLDADDGLTPAGVRTLTAYANAWLKNFRDLDIERRFPEMAGHFYCVRSDIDFCMGWADSPEAELEKALSWVEMVPTAKELEFASKKAWGDAAIVKAFSIPVEWLK